MAQLERAKFGSKLGVVLATAGSAVGLGNVWRFPYMAGENGGAVFIILYVSCVLMLGLPCMISEFIIGRNAKSNTARAYRKLSDGRPWQVIGFLSVLTGFIITGYYAVVSGWCLQYVYASITCHLQGDPEYIKQYFATFSTNPYKPIFWTVIILGITHLVIRHGVRDGIERASKMLMPTLFLLLLIIVVSSCLLPDAWSGVEFLFNPDFSKLTPDVFLGALGQSFYSLSIGMGCICTFASYFSRHTDLGRTAIQIAVIDSLVAVLAGLMIFPAAFSVGVDADSGPSLIFITLPNVFNQAFSAIPSLGYVIGILFYSLLAVAALTSTISMHEIGTAFFQEEMRLSRKVAVVIVTTVASVVCVLSSISMGACPGAMLWGKPLLSFFDFLTAQLMMPAGAFLTTLYVGWVAPKSKVYKQFTNGGMVYAQFFPYFLFLVRFVCPTCILLIFLHELGWI